MCFSNLLDVLLAFCGEIFEPLNIWCCIVIEDLEWIWHKYDGQKVEVINDIVHVQEISHS